MERCQRVGSKQLLPPSCLVVYRYRSEYELLPRASKFQDQPSAEVVWPLSGKNMCWGPCMTLYENRSSWRLPFSGVFMPLELTPPRSMGKCITPKRDKISQSYINDLWSLFRSSCGPPLLDYPGVTLYWSKSSIWKIQWVLAARMTSIQST
jgi:hypothetical protein